MKKIKTVFIIQGQCYSGAEVVLDRYLEDNGDVDPYIVLLFNNKKVIEKFKNKYSKVYTLNLNKYRFLNKIFPGLLSILFWKRIRPVIEKINPDVIYANNSTEVIIAGCMNINIKIPMVAHIHDMVSHMRNPIRKIGIKKIVKNFDAAITVSQAAKKDLSVDKSISVIYNGLKKSYFERHISEKDKSKDFIIGFAGSFIKNKAPNILLRAMMILNKRRVRKNINCKLVYNYKDEKYYNEALSIAKKLEDQIEFIGKLSQSKIEKFYKKIDLLVVPSIHDCLPTVIMEAMAKGTLVIGANVDGIPEMLNDDELLFPKESAEELANTIEEIVQNWNKDKIIQKEEYLFKRSQKLFKDEQKKKKVNEILNSLI